MSGGLYSTEGRDFDQTLDLKKIKPYGDTMNDGKTQLSFTLPVPARRSTGSCCQCHRRQIFQYSYRRVG